MKKIDAIIKGRKVLENLFGIKKRQINRALEGAKDDAEAQKENAVIEYESQLTKLTDDNPNFKQIINKMIEQKQIINDAEATIELITSIQEDLDSEVEEDKKS